MADLLLRPLGALAILAPLLVGRRGGTTSAPQNSSACWNGQFRQRVF